VCVWTVTTGSTTAGRREPVTQRATPGRERLSAGAATGFDDLSTEEGEPLEPHYSSSQCGACGSGLAGDRIYVTVGLREESVL
jgi:hypothetical protein